MKYLVFNETTGAMQIVTVPRGDDARADAVKGIGGPGDVLATWSLGAFPTRYVVAKDGARMVGK